MSRRSFKTRQSIRLLVLIGLTAVFTGLIVHSARAVRYTVGNSRVSELVVAELSLTHEIERGHDGKLTSEYYPEKPPQANPVASGTNTSKAVPPAKAEVKKAAAKKAVPVKTVSKKPLPKKALPVKAVTKKAAPKKPAVKASPTKPAEKKPDPKKPGKKACPT